MNRPPAFEKANAGLGGFYPSRLEIESIEPPTPPEALFKESRKERGGLDQTAHEKRSAEYKGSESEEHYEKIRDWYSPNGHSRRHDSRQQPQQTSFAAKSYVHLTKGRHPWQEPYCSPTSIATDDIASSSSHCSGKGTTPVTPPPFVREESAFSSRCSPSQHDDACSSSYSCLCDSRHSYQPEESLLSLLSTPPPQCYYPAYPDRELEVTPGVYLPLYGSAETIAAMELDRLALCSCFACNETLYCVDSAAYVLCPLCRVVSPSDMLGDGGGLATNESSSAAVGLGVLSQEYQEWQYEQQRKEYERINMYR